MKKWIGAITVMFCIIASISEATVESNGDGTYKVFPDGCVD